MILGVFHVFPASPQTGGLMYGFCSSVKHWAGLVIGVETPSSKGEAVDASPGHLTMLLLPRLSPKHPFPMPLRKARIAAHNVGSKLSEYL